PARCCGLSTWEGRFSFNRPLPEVACTFPRTMAPYSAWKQATRRMTAGSCGARTLPTMAGSGKIASNAALPGACRHGSGWHTPPRQGVPGSPARGEATPGSGLDRPSESEEVSTGVAYLAYPAQSGCGLALGSAQQRVARINC